MRLNTLMKGVAAVAVVAATTVASFSDAEARVRMKVHSAFGKNIVIIGPGPHLVAEAVEKMSDGEVQMKVFEPGALVPGRSILIRSPPVPSTAPGAPLATTCTRTSLTRSSLPCRSARVPANTSHGCVMAVASS